MAIEKVKELLKAVKTDPKVQEALKGLIKPTDEDGIVRYYAEAAKKLGLDVSEADIREVVAAAGRMRAEKTDAAAKRIEALPEEELEKVAGGKVYEEIVPCGENDKPGQYIRRIINEKCHDTYVDSENCWSNDGCDESVYMYKYYVCAHNHFGKVCGDKASFDCQSFIF